MVVDVVKMFSLFVLSIVMVTIEPGTCDYTVTVYPQYLAQNGSTHFETGKWNAHNGMDRTSQISKSKAIGTISGRWMNRDLTGDLFKRVPENPHRKGYADPNHFKTQSFQQEVTGIFMDNIKGYGRDLDIVMILNGRSWPHWMDTSGHGGVFPNNLDAASDMALLLLEAINNHTGILPPYFEEMGEPDARWKYYSWDTVIEFHHLLGKKLKAKFPSLKVGGPDYTSAISSANKNDFRVWNNVKRFMDMSLNELDFFSFHPYNAFHSHGGSHVFSGTNEARLVAVIDLVESYSYHKKGKSVPLLVTEFGLGNLDVDSHTSHGVSQWAYTFLNNAYRFTLLNHRGVVEKAIAFLLGHDAFGFGQASLFDAHGKETFVAKVYRFWKHFYDNQQFLRSDSQYNGGERMVPSLALADPHNKKVTILLHNYHQNSVSVKINFHNRWITPTDAWATCIYLDSNNNPVFHESEKIHLIDTKVNLRGEATCFYVFQTGHNFAGTPIVDETTHYSTGMVYHINNNAVQATVNLPNSGKPHSAYLRFGVSNSNKKAHTTPRSVHINGHPVSEHYSLYDNNRQQSDTLWDVFIYNVPTNILKHGANTVRLEFPQTGGYVSTLALVVGNVNGNPSVIG